jgi:hypothetical protein
MEIRHAKTILLNTLSLSLTCTHSFSLLRTHFLTHYYIIYFSLSHQLAHMYPLTHFSLPYSPFCSLTSPSPTARPHRHGTRALRHTIHTLICTRVFVRLHAYPRMCMHKYITACMYTYMRTRVLYACKPAMRAWKGLSVDVKIE